MCKDSKTQIWDCIIIGSGAAGMSAAINAASEGLSILVIDKSSKTGGLIGTTSLIENYPGFPFGIEGRVLTDNMEQQARNFGAEFLMNTEVLSIDKYLLDPKLFELRTRDNAMYDMDYLYSKSVIMATGRHHKSLGLSNEDQLRDAGILHYGHPDTSQEIKGHICIVGGGNSAGQAATWLTNHACQVTLVAPHFNHMSQYLIDRINENPALNLYIGKVAGIQVGSSTNKPYVDIKKNEGGVSFIQVDQIYSLIGLEVRDEFEELKNENGFLTNCIPGIFVAGDCRQDSEKRCTAAVGEGVAAVSRVHQYLSNLR